MAASCPVATRCSRAFRLPGCSPLFQPGPVPLPQQLKPDWKVQHQWRESRPLDEPPLSPPFRPYEAERESGQHTPARRVNYLSPHSPLALDVSGILIATLMLTWQMI